MSQYKKIEMSANYKYANEIIRLFESNDIHKQLKALSFVEYHSEEDFLSDLLFRSKDCFLTQQKHSLLHFFIGMYINNSLSHERYYLLDSLCDDFELDLIIDFFQTLFDYTIDSKKLKFSYINILKKMDAKYVRSDYTINDDYKNCVNKLFDKFINEFNKVYDDIIESTFFLLYQNKKFLLKFHLFFSELVKEKLLPDNYYNSQGHVIRKVYLPKWLKNAIFYRDRGRCQICYKDLTNLINLIDDKGLHYDHIVPLENGGTNDSTNYQLLCKKCNELKSGNIVITDYQYQMFW